MTWRQKWERAFRAEQTGRAIDGGRATVPEGSPADTFAKPARAQLAQAASRGEAGHLELAYTAAFFDPVFTRAVRPVPEAVSLSGTAHPRIADLPADTRTDGEAAGSGIRRAAVFGTGAGVGIRVCAQGRPMGGVAARPPARKAERCVASRSLAKEPFVAPPRTAPAYRDALLNFCRSAGFIPEVVQEGNNAQCMLELVSAGVGVALVPDTFQRLLAIEVEFRPLAPTPPRWNSTSPGIGQSIAPPRRFPGDAAAAGKFATEACPAERLFRLELSAPTPARSRVAKVAWLVRRFGSGSL